MLPKFLARRLHWTIAAMAASALVANRLDAARWWGFARRSVGSERDAFGAQWWTEARVRLAITLDNDLRRSPAIADVEVHGGEVLVRTDGAPPRNLGAIRRVKGVTDVRCVPVADKAGGSWPPDLVETGDHGALV